jgi:hypothetical protein
MNQRFTNHEITETMITHGGGFVSGLGRLYRSADVVNQARLRDAFPDYWTQYDEMTLLVKQQAGEIAKTS